MIRGSFRVALRAGIGGLEQPALSARGPELPATGCFSSEIVRTPSRALPGAVLSDNQCSDRHCVARTPIVVRNEGLGGNSHEDVPAKRLVVRRRCSLGTHQGKRRQGLEVLPALASNRRSNVNVLGPQRCGRTPGPGLKLLRCAGTKRNCQQEERSRGQGSMVPR